MQSMPHGAMLSVPLGEQEVRELLTPDLDLAAVNAPQMCVVSGPSEAVDQFELWLKERGVESKRLQTSQAFHSAMMDPILEQFRNVAQQVQLKSPRLRYLSNVSGTWIRAEEATDPEY